MKYAAVVSLLILCTAAILTAACTTQQPASSTVQGATVTATAPPPLAHSGGPGVTVKVRMKENSFDPSFIPIKAGTTVTWTNEDAIAHTVTYTGTGATRFDSKNLAKGESFSNTFYEPGRYIYACTQHSFMTGTVVVE